MHKHVILLLLSGVFIFISFMLKNSLQVESICDLASITITSPQGQTFSKACLQSSGQMYSTDTRFTFFNVSSQFNNATFVQTPNIEIKDLQNLEWSISTTRPGTVYLLFRHIPGSSSAVWINNDFIRQTNDDLSNINQYLLRKNEQGLIGLYDIYKRSVQASTKISLHAAFDATSTAFSMYVVAFVPSSSLSPSPSSTGSPSPISDCLRTSGSIVSVSGTQSSGWAQRSLPANTVINATTATWLGVGGNFPVSFGGGSNICWHGGYIKGSWPDNDAWSLWHDRTALYVFGDKPIVENYRADNFGDGIVFASGSTNWTVRNSYFTNMHDDCFEDDYGYSGLVDNVYFECYSTFSATAAGANNVFTVQNSVVREKAQVSVYSGGSPGVGHWFKWDTNGPKIALRNNVFRIDSSTHCCSNWASIPANKLVDCSNNVMVWSGTGPYPYELPASFNGQPCFTITTDISVWDRAVAKWLNEHSYFR